MIIKNQTQLLDSGADGEVAAKAAGHAVSFTKVTVGDANGLLPEFNLDRTSLDNYVKDGAVLSHDVDINNTDQRKLVLRIAPDANYDARELLLYATANGVEFPHSYIRLGSKYPIRTPENDGIQVTIETYIKVSSETVFNINVAPAMDYISRPEYENHHHDDDYKPFYINSNEIAITSKRKFHVFLAQADLQIPTNDGEEFDFLVDESVELSDINKCRLLAPVGKKIIMHKTPYDSIDIQVKNVRHTAYKDSDGNYKI